MQHRRARCRHRCPSRCIVRITARCSRSSMAPALRDTGALAHLRAGAHGDAGEPRRDAARAGSKSSTRSGQVATSIDRCWRRPRPWMSASVVTVEIAVGCGGVLDRPQPRREQISSSCRHGDHPPSHPAAAGPRTLSAAASVAGPRSLPPRAAVLVPFTRSRRPRSCSTAISSSPRAAPAPAATARDTSRHRSATGNRI